MSNLSEYKNLIFYDGDCGFCNSTVQFILKKRKRDFYFVPLQSEKAAQFLKEFDIQIEMDTIYFWNGKKVYNKSGAALQISKGLKGLYPIMISFYIIPRFIRDWIYDGIAKRRHRIRKGFCVLPTNEDEKFLLDD